MSEPRDARASTHVIIGPTAAGKSAIAQHLAERYGLAIVSADSRQVYAGFDIGTAKPSAEARHRALHYGIDVLAPTARYSAHQWALDAEAWIHDARARGCEPLLVGGTGFYVRALIVPLDDTPALDPDRRAELEVWLGSLMPAELSRWCRRLDPMRAVFGRTQQLRAVETALLSGRRISDPFAGGRSSARTVRYLVVDPGAVLGTRIAQRVELMVAAGWVDEVRHLMQAIPADAPAWKACGYTRIREAVDGKVSWAKAVERVIIETRQYAKRQRTWCRHQLSGGQVTLLDSGAPDALARASTWWESDGASRT